MKKKSPLQSQVSQTDKQMSESPKQELTPFQQSQLRVQNIANLARPKLKLARKLSLPLFSIGHTPLITAQILGDMFMGDMSLGDFGEAESKPYLCHIMNLEDMQEGFLICNAVIKSTLEKLEGGYVGRYFQFRDLGKADGKRYRTVDIALMEVE